jgi:hypothetical protein
MIALLSCKLPGLLQGVLHEVGDGLAPGGLIFDLTGSQAGAPVELPPEDRLSLTDVLRYLRFGFGTNPSDLSPMILHVLILVSALHLPVLLMLLDPLPDLPLHLLQAQVLEIIKEVLLGLREDEVLGRPYIFLVA